VSNIPTLASRLNGLSIANVVASSHSYDLNSRRGRRGETVSGSCEKIGISPPPCHSERSEESRSALPLEQVANRGEIPRSARNDTIS